MCLLNADPMEPISDTIGSEHFLTRIAEQICQALKRTSPVRELGHLGAKAEHWCDTGNHTGQFD